MYIDANAMVCKTFPPPVLHLSFTFTFTITSAHVLTHTLYHIFILRLLLLHKYISRPSPPSLQESFHPWFPFCFSNLFPFFSTFKLQLLIFHNRRRNTNKYSDRTLQFHLFHVFSNAIRYSK